NTIMFLWLNKKSLKKIMIFLSLLLMLLFGLLNTNNRVSQTVKKITTESKLDDSSLERTYIYKEAWRQFLKNPVLGNGFNNYREISLKDNELKIVNSTWQQQRAFSSYHSHNNILQLLSSLGIIGGIIYLYYTYLILKELKKSKYFLLGLMLISYFELNGLLDYTIYFYKTEKILFFILGIIILFSKKEKQMTENKIDSIINI
ncbi:MAG: O-antigen ligase family protein, partial [Fusobacteriaceae bacterium]